MLRVFISYRSRERIITDDLCRKLKSQGYPVFEDIRLIEGGGDWRQHIENALKSVTHFFLLVIPGRMSPDEFHDTHSSPKADRTIPLMRLWSEPNDSTNRRPSIFAGRYLELNRGNSDYQTKMILCGEGGRGKSSLIQPLREWQNLSVGSITFSPEFRNFAGANDGNALKLWHVSPMPVSGILLLSQLVVLLKHSLNTRERPKNLSEGVWAKLNRQARRLHFTKPSVMAPNIGSLKVLFKKGDSWQSSDKREKYSQLSDDLLMLVDSARSEAQERLIETYKATLTTFARETFSYEWAHTLRELGNIYRVRARGDREDNLERGIMAYKACLKVFSQDAFPLEWAKTLYELGWAYLNRLRGKRNKNVEIAKAAFQRALTVFSREENALDWARAQCALANALQRVTRTKEHVDNIEVAIQACEAALAIFSQYQHPIDWARAQQNLASAFQNRVHGDRSENLEFSIIAYRAALTVLNVHDSPIEWARSSSGLGSALHQRISGDRENNLEHAIQAYKASIGVLTKNGINLEAATTSCLLGGAYWDRIRGDREENLELAIHAYEGALSVLTPEAAPAEWAHANNNLASAFHARNRGDRSRNLKFAISYYEAALTVFTGDEFPIEWSKTKLDLGRARDERGKFNAVGSAPNPEHFHKTSLNSQVVTLMSGESKGEKHTAADKEAARIYERNYFDNERTILGLFRGVPVRSP
jgi:tetratricopeptide (TPR) repeat protein